MSGVVMGLVVFAALLAVAGGVWVAFALIVALREPQSPAPSSPQRADENEGR